MTIDVSFIIPHKGREEMLEQTLSSIMALDYDMSRIEVLVISQNDSLSLLSRFESTPVRAIFPEKGLTISALRNIGAREAKGQYYAFLDADVALSKNWLTVMKRLLTEEPARKLVSAMQIDSVNAPVLERIRTVLSNAELDTNVSFLPGRNLFLSKETFEQVGGFPEHLVTCEDYYFTDKVNEIGYLYYSSQAQYVHIGEDKKLGLMYEKEVWRGQSNLQSLKGRSIPLREWPSFIVPPAIVLGMLLCLVGGLLSSSNWVLTGLVLCLFPIAMYSFRLYRLAEKKISFFEIVKFYAVYFPARAKGTLLGIVKTFGVKET